MLLQDIKRYLPNRLSGSYTPETEAAPAYDLWSEKYDHQPGNLMLDLDERLFGCLLSGVDITHKKVADIGCGTGRHWAKLFNRQPHSLSGFDVSAGMLNQLKMKFPAAETHLLKDNLMDNVATGNFDTVLSTLTVAHIKNLEAALLSWCRIINKGGDILLTDFHPDLLAAGGQRTFKHGDTHIAVRNYVHKVAHVKAIFALKDWRVVNEEQIHIDEALKPYYERQDALHVYERFKGMPVIYGLHLRQ